MKVFFDSSAFAKRFIHEPGSEAVQKICSEATILGISVICEVEVVSALCRLKRETLISDEQYLAAKRALQKDVKNTTVCNLTTGVIKQSINLLENNLLRAVDAMHIGCAIEWQAELFVSSDARQIIAAENSGLKVVRI